jgi:hypothetical protein
MSPELRLINANLKGRVTVEATRRALPVWRLKKLEISLKIDYM